MTDIFAECRERVSAQQAAQFYGIEQDHHGKALCPFHNDHHPSMTFKGGRFRCWSCGSSGDSIDFVARLFGLEPLAALDKLNRDFVLNLPVRHKPTAQERAEMERRQEIAQAHRTFEEWRCKQLQTLCDFIRAGNQLLAQRKPLESWTDQEAFIVRHLEYFTYLAELLETGSPEDQIQAFKDREGVQAWIDRALQAPLRTA